MPVLLSCRPAPPQETPLIRIAATLASILVLALAAVACGDSEESTTSSSSEATTESTESTTTASATGGCSAVETVEVEPGGTHFDKDFTAEDYDTNPPTSGDHNPTPIETGQFYADPPRLGETVHALEHGAVVGWTNELSPADTKVVEDAFNAEYTKGYFQLAVVENPDLDVPFAMSSWGALQKCDEVDPDTIESFIEEHYAPAETAEGGLACTGQAKQLPACATRDD